MSRMPPRFPPFTPPRSTSSDDERRPPNIVNSADDSSTSGSDFEDAWYSQSWRPQGGMQQPYTSPSGGFIGISQGPQYGANSRGDGLPPYERACALISGLTDWELANDLWQLVDSNPQAVIDMLAGSGSDSPYSVVSTPDSPTLNTNPVLQLPPSNMGAPVPAPYRPRDSVYGTHFAAALGLIPSVPQNIPTSTTAASPETQPFFNIGRSYDIGERSLYDLESFMQVVDALRREADWRTQRAEQWHFGSKYEVEVHAREYDYKSRSRKFKDGLKALAFYEVPHAAAGATLAHGVKERQLQREKNSSWRYFMGQEIVNLIRFGTRDTPRLNDFNRAYEAQCRKKHMTPLPGPIRLAALIPLLTEHESINKRKRRDRDHKNKKFKEPDAQKDFIKLLIERHDALQALVALGKATERSALLDLMARYAMRSGIHLPSVSVPLSPGEEPEHPDCPLCFEPITDVRIKDEVKRPCAHLVCTDCMQRSIDISLKEAKIPTCQMIDCGTPFSAADAQRLAGPGGLSGKALEELQINMFKRTIAADDTWLLCWKCGVDGTPKDEIPWDSPSWTCGHCCASTCKSCGQAGHGNGDCGGVVATTPSYTKEELKALSKDERKRIKALEKAEKKTARALAKQRKAGETQDCPECGTSCQRTGGCRDIACGGCGHHFQWIGKWKG